MSAKAASDLVSQVLSVLVSMAAEADGSGPPLGLVHAFLWALVQNAAYVEAVRDTVPDRGRLAELVDIDPVVGALIASTEAGGAALALDLRDARRGRDGPRLARRRDVKSVSTSRANGR